ncbi:short-chain dehydrogenase/reductase [Phenylobacterium zucineum HLK1]|uniref:Short-chain dehydrogenase/reductase n=1 Tax=Phenylobacterium zucineum (strain HLK1) TaxID=450851 RepID=B4RGQ0_PHEZH|nr:SDR family oxidoreductase [Phenylobacterium zucineum]ACG77266.1 short-chain dehydrogenase/reductase [Phenylobacterium zucineum HLK1]
MRAKLKPLDQQVIVITGASSGIGLATARAAAQAGAAVVLAARNEEALLQICAELEADGGRAHFVVADVGEAEDVARIAREAAARFGGFDTWVNDAGVGIYGDSLEIPVEDHERLFRTNYFGVVNGSVEAARHLKDRPGGGAIINVGSIVSDMASPLMGPYVASKHAVKGFTDCLRMDLQRQGAPVQVTLIKPASIGTPFPEHARNLMEEPARVPPPVYAPEVVAGAILHAARRHVRELTVGGAGRQLVLAQAMAPSLTDRVYAAVMPPLSRRKGEKAQDDSLYSPSADGQARTDAYGSRPFSVYTEAHKRPGLVLGAAILGLAAALAWRNRETLQRQAGPLVQRGRERLPWTRATGTPAGLQTTLH